MTQRLQAIFDGQVLRPEEPVQLQPNTRCTVTVQVSDESAKGGNAWQLLDELAGSIEAPADWSTQHDHYLYGTPKKKP
jgi:hypothetical protein